MPELIKDLTFTNPRQEASFDNWPSGSAKVNCRFYVEHNPKRGFRICRMTTDKKGNWCKPKMRTYSGACVIVDGSDGRTYILQYCIDYRFIGIIRSDFLDASSPVFHNQPRLSFALSSLQKRN